VATVAKDSVVVIAVGAVMVTAAHVLAATVLAVVARVEHARAVSSLTAVPVIALKDAVLTDVALVVSVPLCLVSVVVRNAAAAAASERRKSRRRRLRRVTLHLNINISAFVDVLYRLPYFRRRSEPLFQLQYPERVATEYLVRL